MAAVLSGMVQPTGLIDFNAPGVQDGLKDATDHVKDIVDKLTEKASDAEEAVSKIADLDCTPDDPGACNNGSAGSSTVAYDNCSSTLESCEDNKDTSADLASNVTAIMNALGNMQQETDSDSVNTDRDSIKSQLHSLSLTGKPPSSCTQIKLACDIQSIAKTRVQIITNPDGTSNQGGTAE
jgi:hypothetical protein